MIEVYQLMPSFQTSLEMRENEDFFKERALSKEIGSVESELGAQLWSGREWSPGSYIAACVVL